MYVFPGCLAGQTEVYALASDISDLWDFEHKVYMKKAARYRLRSSHFCGLYTCILRKY